MTKKVKERIGFHYLLTKIQLCNLILLVDCTNLLRKSLLDYTKSFSPNDFKKNDKIIYISTLKTNMAIEKAGFESKLKK